MKLFNTIIFSVLLLILTSNILFSSTNKSQINEFEKSEKMRLDKFFKNGKVTFKIPNEVASFDKYRLIINTKEIIYPNHINFIDFEPMGVRFYNESSRPGSYNGYEERYEYSKDDRRDYFSITDEYEISIWLPIKTLKLFCSIPELDMGINGNFKPKIGLKSELLLLDKEQLDTQINKLENKNNK